VLEINIAKRLGDFHLNLSFTAGQEILVLFGPCGAGKSLALQCIAGLMQPDQGLIRVNGQTFFQAEGGRVLQNVPAHRRSIGYVFQSYALFPHLTVAQNIAYGGRGRPGLEDKTRRLLERMRLQGLEARYPAQLSGGQQQRVAIARALMIEPAVLLLDEPFSALDSAVREKLQGELLGLQREMGLSVIYVTHLLADAFALGDRMAVINDGRLEQIGAKQEVYQRPATRAVARFTGTRNIFDGQVLAVKGREVHINWCGQKVTALAEGLAQGDQVSFCIRPEEVMVVRPDRPRGDSVKENLLSGSVVREITRGATYTIFFRADALPEADYHLEILLPSHAYERLGLASARRSTVSLKKTAIHVLPKP